MLGAFYRTMVEPVVAMPQQCNLLLGINLLRNQIFALDIN